MLLRNTPRYMPAQVVVGPLLRQGWGDDWRALEAFPGVTLHGYQASDRVKQRLHDADIFICTSHDEGLGLPQWRSGYVARATQNLKRWNTLASADRDAVIGLIAELAERQGPARPANRRNNRVGH
jgi:hypothetical protein